jgi:hypothetical protein
VFSWEAVFSSGSCLLFKKLSSLWEDSWLTIEQQAR